MLEREAAFQSYPDGGQIPFDFVQIEALPCGFCRISLEKGFRILYANAIYYAMCGYTPQQALLEGFNAPAFVMHPKDYPSVAERIREHVAAGEPVFELEHRQMHRDGDIRWILVRCFVEGEALNCVLFDITDRKRAEERLQLSEEENRLALQSCGKMIDVYDVKTLTLRKSPEGANLLGLPQNLENVPYSIVKRGIVAPDSAQEYIRFFEEMQKGTESGEAILQMKGCGGEWHWFSVGYHLIYGKDGEPQRAILTYEDITTKREKELAYQKWMSYFEQQKPSSIGYYEYNLTRNLYDGSEQDVSQVLPDYVKSFTGAVRFFTEHDVCEEDIEAYFAFYNRERLLLRYYEGQEYDAFEYRRKTADGLTFWARGTVQMLRDTYTGDIKAFILVQNIDQEKREHLKIQERIERDPLTGLYNRAATIEHINELLKNIRPDGIFAFVMLDIDYFKNLNDSFGHQFGDQVLRDVAVAMKETLKEGELCGRLGGDEFVLFLRDISSIQETEERLGMLCECLRRHYSTGASVSISVGVAIWPRDGYIFEELYQKADAALYEAKGLGRNRYVIYHKKGEL